jgi:hypothetical protein
MVHAGALVGAVELVAAVVLVTLNAWIQRQFLGALAKICGEAGVPKFCDGKQHYERECVAACCSTIMWWPRVRVTGSPHTPRSICMQCTLQVMYISLHK